MFELDHTFLTIMVGAIVLGVTSGVLGSFAMLRRQSLLGDAISHAALPGVALAFLVTLSKNPFVLLLGALVTGWLGTLLVLLITRKTNLKEDAALGIILAVFFGAGLFLLTYIQRLPTAKKAGLSTYLFGNASTMLTADVVSMALFGGAALLAVTLFWKEFKLLAFDATFAKSIGMPVLALELGLTTLIVIAIVIGLQMVGAVLMSAMVVAPAVAARQWTDRLGVMVALAGIFAAVSGAAGTFVSSQAGKIPTGPVIVVIITLIAAFSLFASPHRGILWDWVRRARNRRKIHVTRCLLAMRHLSESHHDLHHPHTLGAIRALDASIGESTLQDMERQGYVTQSSKGWMLTALGFHEATKAHEGAQDRAEPQAAHTESEGPQ